MKKLIAIVSLALTVYSSNAQIITTYAGNGIAGSTGDGGSALTAELDHPFGIAIDPAGNVYIADYNNNKIRKVSTTGIITTIVGTGSYGYSGDGGPATAADIAYPCGVALDASGNIYVADKDNQRIRKVNTSGIITTVAGTGVPGYAGDGGAATLAQIQSPFDIVIDGSGNIIFADYNNQCIRKVNTSGIITTVAGNHTVGYSGDGGPATNAALNYPMGVTVDGAENIYIACVGNHVVRKVNSSGIISTFAGNTIPAYTGDGGPATAASINYPGGMVVDGAGNVYLADQDNYAIRKISTSGIITTVAGIGIAGFSGDCGPATNAQIVPTKVTINSIGNLFIADNGNMRVRKISAPMGIITGSSNVCIGTPLTLADTSSGGTWSSSSTGIATIGSGTGIVTGVTVGIDTITYTMPTGCTASKAITINPLPNAGSITGLSVVCAGSLLSLTDVSTGGIWSATNSDATVSGGLVTGMSAGTDTVKYTVNNVCGTAVASFPVTVNPLPSPGTISGSSVVCTGSAIALTDAISGGLWSETNGNANLSGGIVTGITSGIDTIIYLVINSCGVATTTKIVTINPSPTAGTIIGSSSVCARGTTTLTDTAIGGTWTATNSNATVSSGIVLGINAGIDTIKYSVSNSCGTAITSKIITINPLPNAGTIVGLSTICTGTTISLTDTAIGGDWMATNGKAIVSTSGAVYGVTAGIDTIIYTITNLCGTATAIKVVTVNTTVPNAGVISGPSTVCISSTITLTDAVTGGVWNVSNANATVIGGVVTGVTTGIDTILYSITNSCGSASTTKVISINPLPSVGAITGFDTVCMTHTLDLTDTTTGGAWSTATGNAIATSTGIVIGINYGFDTVLYTITNACGSVVAKFPIFVTQPGECELEVITISTSSLQVYPNPTTGEIIISGRAIPKIKVYNSIGQLLKEVTNTNSISIAEYPIGLYVIMLFNTNGELIQENKIIKE